MKRVIALVALAALLAGCSKVNLYSQLSEQQANEIVALLLASDIDADKEPVDEETWAVTTGKADVPRAVNLLRENGLPRETYESFGEVFRKEGFVSSPLEERARFLYALSQELSRTVSTIDGVIVARVHVAVPERDPLSDTARPSSASVFIKHRPDSNVASHVAEIKAFVVNSIEGLPYDNVTVTLFPASVAQRDAAPPQLTSQAGLMGNPWFFPAMSASGVLLAIAVALSALARLRPVREVLKQMRERMNAQVQGGQG
jgi:type III secretion protein J